MSPCNDTVELIVNAGNSDSQITVPVEQDRYHFDVAEFNKFTIETSGAADTVTTLFDPSTTGNYQIAASSSLGTTISQIELNGAELEAEITNPQEIDLFRFNVQNQDVYTIETTDSTDT